MKFKIDTKEKFTVITPISENLSDNLTAELIQTATAFLQKDDRNVVLNLKNVFSITESAAAMMVKLEQTFHENNASFVMCELQPSVQQQFTEYDFEFRNITPTESEAWDIVQMEEIERELMSDEGFNDSDKDD
jgi:anti-anti-sigma regulatory factor